MTDAEYGGCAIGPGIAICRPRGFLSRGIWILLTSPRMHKLQVELIEGQAEYAMDELRKLGVRFAGDSA